MILKNANGIYTVEVPTYPFDEAEEIQYYNNKFGIGKWMWAARICSYLSPHCGYGEPLDKSTCETCDGKCMRPKESTDNVDYGVDSMETADGNWRTRL